MITLSQLVKAAGFKSVGEFAEFVGVPRRTLYDRFKVSRREIDCLIAGAALLLEKEKSQKESGNE